MVNEDQIFGTTSKSFQSSCIMVVSTSALNYRWEGGNIIMISQNSTEWRSSGYLAQCYKMQQ